MRGHKCNGTDAHLAPASNPLIRAGKILINADCDYHKLHVMELDKLCQGKSKRLPLYI